MLFAEVNLRIRCCLRCFPGLYRLVMIISSDCSLNRNLFIDSPNRCIQGNKCSSHRLHIASYPKHSTGHYIEHVYPDNSSGEKQQRFYRHDEAHFTYPFNRTNPGRDRRCPPIRVQPIPSEEIQRGPRGRQGGRRGAVRSGRGEGRKHSGGLLCAV